MFYKTLKCFTPKVFVWGNLNYQFKYFKPTFHPELSALDPISMSGGQGHLAVVSNDHKLYTMGSSEKGQCGVYEYQVERPLKLMEKPVAQVYCGKDYTIAVGEDLKTVYVTGCNEGGKLGIGDVVEDIAEMREMKLSLESGDVVKKVACGSGHVMVLSEKGKLYCSGIGHFGMWKTGVVNRSRTTWEYGFVE